MGFGCYRETDQALYDLKTDWILKFMKFIFELKALGEQTTVGFSFEPTSGVQMNRYKITTDNTPGSTITL